MQIECICVHAGYTCACVCVDVCIYIYRHTNKHTYIHICIHTYMHTYIHIQTTSALRRLMTGSSIRAMWNGLASCYPCVSVCCVPCVYNLCNTHIHTHTQTKAHIPHPHQHTPSPTTHVLWGSNSNCLRCSQGVHKVFTVLKIKVLKIRNSDGLISGWQALLLTQPNTHTRNLHFFFFSVNPHSTKYPRTLTPSQTLFQ